MKRHFYFFTICFLVFQVKLLAQAPNISYITPQNYTVGKEITPLNPSNTGGAISYGSATTLAGGCSTDGIGSTARFYNPNGVAVDGSGNLYVADTKNNKIRKINPQGVVTTFAGSGMGTTVDGIGTVASFEKPLGITIDAFGTIYVSELYFIRKISPAGVVTTLAGSKSGSQGFADGVDTDAKFYNPNGLAVDSSGNVYVADTDNQRIRKITPAGIVTTFAGSSSYGSTDGIGSAASFFNPSGIVVDALDNLYVADCFSNKIRKITQAHEVTTFAGGGYGDGTGTKAGFSIPRAISIDASGNIFITEGYGGSGYNKIRKITSAGVVTTLAGSTSSGSTDGTGATASFSYLNGIAVDAFGNIYVTDTDNNKIRKVTSDGIVTTLAGSMPMGSNEGTGSAARFNYPEGVVVDAFDNIYVADTKNNQIRKITPTGVVTNFAGSTTKGSANATGSASSFSNPRGIAIDATGTIYVADTENHEIRKITQGGIVTTFSGSLDQGSADGAAANFSNPSAVAVDATGNVYVADTDNNKIRKITPTGIVSTLAGNTTAGYKDGTSAAAQFDHPQGVAVDSQGNVYVSDTGNDKIRKITPAGVVTSFARYFNNPKGIAIDALGNIYVTESKFSPSSNITYTGGCKIIKITPAGVLTTLAGSFFGYADGTGTEASFAHPSGVAVGTFGNLYIADTDNQLIRKLNSGGYTITPQLPASLNIDIVTGTISGTPTVVSSATIYTVTATNTYGRSTTNVVIGTIGQKPAISYASTQHVFSVGTTITSLTPTNAGSPVLSYSISPTLPSGLNFNASKGVISGKPTVVKPATNYVITASNSYGTGSFSISISTVYAKPTISYVNPQNLEVGIVMSPLQPVNTGSPVTSYSISPNLPSGLSLNMTTGAISGTPTIATVQATYTVTATNSYGNGTTTIVITVNSGGTKPVISYATPQIFTVGTTITNLTPTNTGSPATSYTITPSLPSGLVFNTATGIISGTPTVVSSQGTYTVTATNSYGSGTTTIVITVNSGGTKPLISYATPQIFTVGTTITNLTPSNTGSPTTSYTITPSLPTGLVFNTATGIISGIPTVISSQATYTVTATNSYGNGSTTIGIIVNSGGTKPVISYATPQIFTVGTTITNLTPINTGSPAPSYSIAPNLPTGLVFNTATGIISGIPTIASAQTSYTITATNSYGSGSTTINITVIAAQIILSSNNFAIESKGESCLGINNGEINIIATATYPYKASINGQTYSFTSNSLKVSNLVPGTYNVSVTITGEIFEQDFTIVIPKGATITGKSSVTTNKVAIAITEGTAPYTVSIDGVEQFETTDTNFSVGLTKKGGLLEVKTAKACEGVYTKDIAGLEPFAFAVPNPTSGSFEIEVATLKKEVVIELYTLNGQMISNKKYAIENGRAKLSLEEQASGIYVAKIQLDTPCYLKIIKN